MNYENLKSWALGAEIVGGLAVVVTLGIVAFELDQSTKQSELNTNALEIASYQSLIESIIELNSLIVTDPNLARLETQVRENHENFTEEELRQLNAYYINVIRHGDLAYFQFERGLIDEDRLRSALGILVGNLRDNPVALSRWDRSVAGAGSLNESYIEYVENLLDRN